MLSTGALNLKLELAPQQPHVSSWKYELWSVVSDMPRMKTDILSDIFLFYWFPYITDEQ